MTEASPATARAQHFLHLVQGQERPLSGVGPPSAKPPAQGPATHPRKRMPAKTSLSTHCHNACLPSLPRNACLPSLPRNDDLQRMPAKSSPQR